MKLILAMAVLIGACAWAQEAPQATQQDAPTQQETQPAPAEQGPATVPEPAPIAPLDAGPQTEPSTAPPEPDYGGPAILSRLGGPTIGRTGTILRLRPFFTANAIYDSNLGTTSLGVDGRLPSREGYGVESTFGVSGTRIWKRDFLNLDYRGSLRHYTQNSYYDGFDNSLMLGFRHRISSRTEIVLSEGAARYQRGFALPLTGYYNTGFESYDPTFNGLTTNDLFDNPTTALRSAAQLVHQFSSRWSVGVGGDGFFVRHHSSALIDSNGYTARGDLAYRLTRYQSIGMAYDYSHYDFRNRYGQSDIHGVQVMYAVRVGRYWEISTSVGGYRVETIGLTRIQIDPVIAALLGQQFAISKSYDRTFLPRFGGHISRRFRRSSASLNYDRTVHPGNGVYMTSGYESASLGLSYAPTRRLSLQLGADYSRYSSVSQNIGRYRSFAGSSGFGYQLARGVSIIGRGDWRHFYVTSSGLNRNYYRVVVGFGWSPSEFPFSLW